MEATEFLTLCLANGIIIGQEQFLQLKRYAKELAYWNGQVNLISRKDIDNIWDKHILHSLAAVKYIKFPNRAKCLDVGTGGGLPGIPIAIAVPDCRMLLIDSIGKKIKIADMLAKHTELKHITAKQARAEEISAVREYRKSFDLIFSRSVARIKPVVRWITDLLKPGGRLIFYKGGDLREEFDEAREAFPKLQFEEIKISMFGCEWFEQEEKKLVVCRI
ncbi:MAG: methyltransferase GidB [Ignavibacteria bacterium]|nr:methyltransferase GidB [Ignavibacteria bacterium]